MSARLDVRTGQRCLPILLPLLAAGCAALRPPPVVELPPEPVEARTADLDLVGRNEAELWAVGQAARQAGDWRRAASAFGRLADLHPASPHRLAALRGAGEASERLEAWRQALSRYRELRRLAVGPEADRASLDAALCHHQLGEREEARALLEGLAAREQLAPADRTRALAELGVLELEAGEDGRAGRSLEAALEAWGRADDAERVDDEAPAKAHFWLGEVWGRRFEAAPLDFTAGEEALADALEHLATLLVQAQKQYLQAASRRHPSYGVAGITRVGGLYERFHARLAQAPVPPGLSAAEGAAWREALRRELRVLLQGAIDAYAAALDAARGRGVDSDFSAEADRSLQRLQRLLADEPAAAR